MEYGRATSSYHPAAVRQNYMRNLSPTEINRCSIDNFLTDACHFGFFLNETLFRSSALLPLPLNHPYRPSTALLSAVYLWGIHLSSNEAMKSHEATFLARALEQTSTALASSHPKMIIHALQAEILLSCYFLRSGRFLEGKFHVSAAASLAISCGLNKIRSSHNTPTAPDFVGSTGAFDLPPPIDAVEEGERINGFWAVFVLDKCWSVALGSPSHFTDSTALGTRIDTPWPLENQDYEQVSHLFNPLLT